MSSNSRPPAPCSAGMPIPRYARIAWPATANSVMTSNEINTACRAALARAAGGLRPVRLRNTGTVPGGSMMTSSVITAEVKTSTSKYTASASHRCASVRTSDESFVDLRVGGLGTDRGRLVGTVVVARPRGEQVQLGGELAQPLPGAGVVVRVVDL